METIHQDKNLTIRHKIGRKIGEARCDFPMPLGPCGQKLRQIYTVEREGVLVGTFGSTHKDRILEAESLDGLLGPMDIPFFFRQANVTQLRAAYDRTDADPRNVSDLVDAVLRLKDDQYLQISEDFQIVPNIENWRKRGDFILVVPSYIDKAQRKREDIRAKTRERLRIYEGRSPKAGVETYFKGDNRYRIHPLESMCSGKKIFMKLEAKGNPIKYRLLRTNEIWEAYAEIPSTTRPGKKYVVKITRLPKTRGRQYADSFGAEFDCQCEDSIFSNMAHKGKNPPVRGCLHGYALAYKLEYSGEILRPITPLDPGRGFLHFKYLLNRVVRGSEKLSKQETEIVLWNYFGRHKGIVDVRI